MAVSKFTSASGDLYTITSGVLSHENSVSAVAGGGADIWRACIDIVVTAAPARHTADLYPTDRHAWYLTQYSVHRTAAYWIA